MRKYLSIFVLLLLPLASLRAASLACEDFWPAARTTAVVGFYAGTAETITLDNVVVPALPAGAVVRSAHVLLSSAVSQWRSPEGGYAKQYPFRSVVQVRKSGGSFVDGIRLYNNYRYHLFGKNDLHPINWSNWSGGPDVKAVVNGAGTYNFQWCEDELLAASGPDSLFIYYCRPGLRLIYEY